MSPCFVARLTLPCPPCSAPLEQTAILQADTQAAVAEAVAKMGAALKVGTV